LTAAKTNNMLKFWIEAMRLRTLPVSLAGVVLSAGLCLNYNVAKPCPLVLCLVFALLAQIASNFANEYYDFRDGLDKPGRDGPRRGVTEGDITPGAMKIATFLTLALACIVGLMLIPYGGWQLIIAGVAIILGVLAYSTGPYPLSRHGLGEVAVIFYFGIIPVNLTFYVCAGFFTLPVLCASVAIGLMGANVLIVNNYRDAQADAAVSKRTLANILGPSATRSLYYQNGAYASALLCTLANRNMMVLTAVAVYLVLHIILCKQLARLKGSALNPLLGKTAVTMFATAIVYFIVSL